MLGLLVPITSIGIGPLSPCRCVINTIVNKSVTYERSVGGRGGGYSGFFSY